MPLEDCEYDDSSDLIEDTLQELAKRRAKFLGDDLAAIALLVAIVESAKKALERRVSAAYAAGHNWQEISSSLAMNIVEARIRFDHHRLSEAMADTSDDGA